MAVFALNHITAHRDMASSCRKHEGIKIKYVGAVKSIVLCLRSRCIVPVTLLSLHLDFLALYALFLVASTALSNSLIRQLLIKSMAITQLEIIFKTNGEIPKPCLLRPWKPDTVWECHWFSFKNNLSLFWKAAELHCSMLTAWDLERAFSKTIHTGTCANAGNFIDEKASF